MKIKKLLTSEHESVRSLFHENDPNLVAIYGVIEGLIPGQIWVNEKDNPTMCLINCEDSYCFIAGKLNQDIFQEFVALIKQKENVRLQYLPRAHYPGLNLADFGFRIIPRREYKYKNISLDIPYYENNTQYIIKKIEDKKIFNLCMWKQLVLGIYLTPENYLKNSLGFILWDEDKKLIVSEAHGISSKKLVEIATITHEDYRGKKLSTILCNYFIHYLVNKNLHPIWACDEENIASWKVAEHQGMNGITKYVFYGLGTSQIP